MSLQCLLVLEAPATLLAPQHGLLWQGGGGLQHRGQEVMVPQSPGPLRHSEHLLGKDGMARL